MKLGKLPSGFVCTFHSYLVGPLYGLGTNTGLKRVSASDLDITYKDLLYVRRKFIQKDSLRRAIALVVNAPDVPGTP